MSIFINALASISPQPTINHDFFLTKTPDNQLDSLKCIEPNYKELIPIRQLRRMSRMLKMGAFAAKKTLIEAGIEIPDAIITGTGMGCMEDTEKFLESIYRSEKGLVSPTPFIQSTHNTVSSLIALFLKCYHYNFTYVHRGFSFESALQDALLFLEEQKSANVLVGGIDEIIETYQQVTNRLKMWEGSGNLAGEGASFFLLSTKPTKNCYAQIKGLKMMYKPKNQEIERGLQHFLQDHNITLKELDLVCLGQNGNPLTEESYEFLKTTLFPNHPIIHFKHLCGAYKTANAFALWLTAQILQKQIIPDIVKMNSFERRKICNILIYNNYQGINHSFLFIEKVDSINNLFD